jgi:hypothetical protein
LAQSKNSTIYFGLAIFVLGTSAVAMQVVDFNIIKKPLPIRKPLVDMSPSSLGPFDLVNSRRLSVDVTGELGTEEYIEWALRDRRIKNDAESFVSLFVTYYTNVQDQVPHVPEECYNQAQNTLAGDGTLDVQVDGIDETVRVRRLGFFAPNETKTKNFVYYTISVNGTFHAGRQTARIKMSNPLETHLYYSKIEISFPNRTDDDIPELDRRASELMNESIRVLFQDHWPPPGTEVGGYEAFNQKQSSRTTNDETGGH